VGFPNSKVSYTSGTTGRGDHEVHNGHVVASGKKYMKEKPVAKVKGDISNNSPDSTDVMPKTLHKI
jgi:hypothetical protein